MAERASAVRRRVAVWTGGEWAYIVDDWPYLPLTGGTLYGDLSVLGSVSGGALDANSYGGTSYVINTNVRIGRTKSSLGYYLHIGDSGAHLEGPLVIKQRGSTDRFRLQNAYGSPYAPTEDDELTTKSYADTKLALSGGTVTGNITLKSVGIIYEGATHAGGTANRIGFRWASPNIVATVDNAVSAVAATVSTGSLKTGIRPVPDALGLLRRLRPVMFSALDIDGSRAGGPDHVGLVAEEVAAALPSAALRADDGAPVSVNYNEIVALLVAALQEAVERIAVLEGAASG